MHEFSCKIDLDRRLNPALEQDALASRMLGVLGVQITNTVRTFLYDEVRPCYGAQYRPIEPRKSYKLQDGQAALSVELVLPQHEDMSGISSLLHQRLLDDLTDTAPQLAGKIRITIGPRATATV